jgi:hypothetical protein
MDDNQTGDSAGLSKDSIFDASENEWLRIAVKNATATHSAEVVIYKPDHSKLAFYFGIAGNGQAYYVDSTGSHLLYSGSLNTWYEFRVVIRWSEQTYDIAIYNKNGNKLAEAKDLAFYNGAFVLYICHILFYSSIAGTGTSYYDGCSVTTYYPPTEEKIDAKETGILLTEQIIDPAPASGHWIVDYWVRHVRSKYDKTLSDNHNIPRAVLSKIKDIETQKQ